MPAKATNRKKDIDANRLVVGWNDARDHDVLSGRGDRAIRHVGNGNYRVWINERKHDYDTCENKRKRSICWEVINLVHHQKPPGRFLRQQGSGGRDLWWEELTEKETILKTSQAFRDSKGIRANSGRGNRTLGAGAKIVTASVKKPVARNIKRPSTSSSSTSATKRKAITPDEKLSTPPRSSNSSRRTSSPRLATKKRYPPPSDNEDEDEDEDETASIVVPIKRPRLSSEEEDDDGETTSTESTSPTKQHLDPFANLLLSDNFSDVEIVCEHDNGSLSVSFPGHKAMLASSSPVLKAALEADPACTSVAFHYPGLVVKEVLAYIYSKKCAKMDQKVMEEYLWDFLSITKAYKLIDLYNIVFEKASHLVNMGNLMDTFVTADQQGIKDVCLDFVKQNPARVLTDRSFVRLATKDPSLWSEIVNAALSGADTDKQVVDDDEAYHQGRNGSYDHAVVDSGYVGGNMTV